MYLYRVRWFYDGEYHWSSGIAAGKSISEALVRIDDYYGGIEDIRIIALESSEGLLDFEEFDNITLNTFLPNEKC